MGLLRIVDQAGKEGALGVSGDLSYRVGQSVTDSYAGEVDAAAGARVPNGDVVAGIGNVLASVALAG